MKTALTVKSAKDVRQIKGLSPSIRIAFLALTKTRIGALTVELPDGRSFRFDQGEPGPTAEFRVLDPRMAGRVLSGGDIGFADAYMDEQFETDDLTSVLEYFAVNFEAAGRLSRGSPIRNAIMRVLNSLLKQNTKNGSKQNILAHYDLGNEFYSLWLDPSMTYSSAIFENQTEMGPAQAQKYDAIAQKIEANPNAHLLEIGSGWGGFAEHAAKTYGSRITTITISDAQHAYASQRIFEAGLNERVKVELRDYRDVEGEYDGIASIEMFEAVGEQFWPGYFNKVSTALKQGKRAALQIITIDDHLFEGYRQRVDFIQKHIFPGGMLPSVSELKDQFTRAGLKFEQAHMFGQSYAKTLNEWAENFRAAWPDIEKLGFDRSFRNLWEYYLCYCEAGFKTGRTDVGQFVVQRA